MKFWITELCTEQIYIQAYRMALEDMIVLAEEKFRLFIQSKI